MTYQSAHLIANNLTVIGDLPADVGSGVTLRRPTELEIDKIRQSLDTVSGTSVSLSWYEYEFTKETDSNTSIAHIDEPQRWHYYVLSDDQGGAAVYDLAPALVLMNPSIDLSVRVLSTRDEIDAHQKYTGISPAPPHVVERYHYVIGELVRNVVSVEDFQRADSLRACIAALDEPFTFVRNAVAMMKDVRLVPQRSPLYVVGHFAVVESLVAHSPRLPESLDSISHQFQGKLSLLTNQLDMKPFVEQHFGADKNIWKRLYSYRSALAHGNLIDFKKDFVQLKNQENVTTFMAELTRRLILNALEQPQFYSDLKQC